MSKYTKEDIMNLVEEEDVEFIRLQFTDMAGMFKNVAITSSQLERALNNDCMFDCSSVSGFFGLEESDLYLYPDLDTFTIFPWRPQQGKVARLICDLYHADRTPLESDGRYILKKAIKEAEQMGYTFQVGPECEFFLFHTDENGLPTTITHEQAGFFDMSPLDFSENTRRDVVLTLEDMGYCVEASHHEKGASQHEIDVRYDDVLKTADTIMTLRMVVKTIAKHHGLHATFMPKPKTNECGSGMHINMSLSKDGKNIFAQPDGKNGLSKEAYYFIGGLMKHVKGMCAIANPLINSYKRLVPGFEAPCNIVWSSKGNNPIIRVPASRGESTRIELRSPDATCNPYLTLAACLFAGLDGIKNQIEPPEELEEDITGLSRKEIAEKGIEFLPSDLYDAANAFRKSEIGDIVFGEKLKEIYYEKFMDIWREYEAQVTEWEINSYLYKY